jgi:hypothetical protein
MKKSIPIFIAISSLLFSCGPQRRDICDCLNIEAALTDSLLLSKKELKAKSEGCAWVAEELSPAEQSAKLIECYSKNLPSVTTDKQETEEPINSEDSKDNSNKPKPNPGF